MSHLLQRDLSCLWCSGFFGVWCLWFFGLFAGGLFGLFLVLFLVSLCFLHALALSLTGAQRTDSSFASKKSLTTWFLFTDVSHEPGASLPFSGIGAVLVGPSGKKFRFLSEKLSCNAQKSQCDWQKDDHL